jgi:prepilin-type N-terminal cleavage/methylation domain-containing protein
MLVLMRAQVQPSRPRHNPRSLHGFSIIELLVSIAVIAVLLSLLLPMLVHARRVSSTAQCSSNLRQIGVAMLSYLHDHEVFPKHAEQPDWRYGGVHFTGMSQVAAIDPSRPINRYLREDVSEADDRAMTMIFRCAGDRGAFRRDDQQNLRSVLPRVTAYQTYGTSYRANPYLMDSTRAGIDKLRRPLRVNEVFVSTSRLLMIGDATWYYATRKPGMEDSQLVASWHGKRESGNMLAMDGSVQFLDFSEQQSARFDMMPRPELTGN